MRAAGLAMALVLVLLGGSACGDDDADGLPPGDDAGLAATFQPLFEPLGLQFTYGSIADARSGKHLALYVEPTAPATDEQYLDRLLRSAQVVIPAVFDRYPDVASFDLCQEPVPTGPGDPARPEPRTVVLLRRAQAESVDDWSTATLADLITASRVGRDTEIRVDEPIARLPAYVAALAAADAVSPPDRETAAGY